MLMIEKKIIKKAKYLVDNYKKKYDQPDQFINYRNKRERELEKVFIKEYIKNIPKNTSEYANQV